MAAISNTYKIIVVMVLMTACAVITYYFQVLHHVETVYTHFYYIPIILGCFWWKRKGLAVPAFFVVLLLSGHLYAKGLDASFPEDILRAAMFLFIGVVVSLLSERLMKVENELRLSNEFHQTVLNSLAHPFYVVDADDYSISLSNLEAYLGRAIPDKITCHQIAHNSSVPCNTDTRQCPLQEVKRTGLPQKMEHLHYDKNGKPIHVEVYAYPVRDHAGNISKIIEYSIDITERRNAEDKLRYEKAFIENLIDIAPAIIVVLDTEGQIVSFNRFMEKTSGYRLEDVKGRDWFDTFLPAQDRDNIRNLFFRAAGSVQARGTVHRIVTKDGSERYIEWYDKLIQDPAGHVEGVLSIGEDITDRRRLEAVHEKLNHEHQDALARVKQLSGLLPICGSCKKIRDDKIYWDDVASYVTRHPGVIFKHGLCPDCAKKTSNKLDELINLNPQSSSSNPKSAPLR